MCQAKEVIQNLTNQPLNFATVLSFHSHYFAVYQTVQVVVDVMHSKSQLTIVYLILLFSSFSSKKAHLLHSVTGKRNKRNIICDIL